MFKTELHQFKNVCRHGEYIGYLFFYTDFHPENSYLQDLNLKSISSYLGKYRLKPSRIDYRYLYPFFTI